jgi:hypothetical protein
VTTATNKPASGNNANGVITLQQIMVRSISKLPLLIMTTYILELTGSTLQNGGRLFIQVT